MWSLLVNLVLDIQTARRVRTAIRLGLLAGVVQLTSSAVADAQQPGYVEPVECAQARQLWQQNRVAANNLLRICQEKKRAAFLARQQQSRSAPWVAPPLPAQRRKGVGTVSPGVPSAPPASGRVSASDARFPSVADVTASISGSDAKDTAAQQEATFKLLNELLEHVYRGNMNNPTQGMPPDMVALYVQYKQAANRAEEVVIPGKSATTMTSSPALHYYLSTPFRRQVLGRYASEALVDDYEREHWAQQEKADAAAQQERAQDQAAGQTEQLLSRDVKEANDHGIDLGVFGIQLAQRIKLPACPNTDSGGLAEAFMGSSVPETCVVTKAQTFDQGIAQLVAASNSVPWVSTGVSVKLAASKCPDWMKLPFGCSIIFNVKNGVALGATFQTGGADYQDKIIRALTKKYNNKAPRKAGDTWCRNNLTGIVTEKAPARVWDLHGLFVLYEPIISCGNMGTTGRITVELPQFREARDNVERKQEETAPKM